MPSSSTGWLMITARVGTKRNLSLCAGLARPAVAQDAGECVRAEPVPAQSDWHAVGAGERRPTGPAFPQVGRRLFSAFEMFALGSGSDPPGEQFVRADDP